MSYVEHCTSHGQYHGEYCGDCVEAAQAELESLRVQLETQIKRVSALEEQKALLFAQNGRLLEELESNTKHSEVGLDCRPVLPKQKSGSDSRAERYKRAAELLRKWSTEPGDYDERVYDLLDTPSKTSSQPTQTEPAPVVDWVKNDIKDLVFVDGSRFLVALRVSHEGGPLTWEFDVVSTTCDGEYMILHSDGENYSDWTWSDFEFYALVDGELPWSEESTSDRGAT